MCAARKQDDEGHFAVTSEGRAVALFRLVLAFMLAVMLAFVLVEGWRIWRDYRYAYSNAENMVSNLARATAQHAEDAIRQVDAITAALAESWPSSPDMISVTLAMSSMFLAKTPISSKEGD